jgi:hypothetical protein
MSLQLSYGTAAETDFKPTGRNWPPDFRLVNSICRDGRIAANGATG